LRSKLEDVLNIQGKYLSLLSVNITISNFDTLVSFG